jgi:hypothetical protein
MPRIPAFWLKVGLAAALVALADVLFFAHEPGSTVGLFALAWVAALVLVRRGVINDRRGRLALVAAGVFAFVMVDRPNLLTFLLFGLSLTVAALSARVRPGEPAWNWAQRLVVHWIVATFGPALDALRLSRLKRRGGSLSALALLGRLAMPVVGGAVFLALFSIANPVISDLLGRLALPPLSPETVAHGLFWLVVAVAAWATLRPRWRRGRIGLPERKVDKPWPALTTSITWSLVVFNAVFALQNGLDIVFLWSGASLPGDMSLADYAHRGAYPLIATALLAALFVLVALQPGSETATRPLVRRLVVLWIGQNVLLVASSMLRTLDYIDAYALTRLRIAALIWMALVAVGLGLICWRLLKGKSAHWLIDTNVAAGLAVLGVITFVDLGALASAWNVRHAREVGGRGVQIDLGYLRSLGAPALVSLVELEQRLEEPGQRDRVAAARQVVLEGVRKRQSAWRGWTWRDQRRLDKVDALSRARPLATPAPGFRDWNERLPPPPAPSAPPPASVAPAPVLLTSPARG